MKFFTLIIFVCILTVITFFSAELMHYYFLGNQGSPWNHFRKTVSGNPHGKFQKNLGYIGNGNGKYKSIRTRGHEIISESVVTIDGHFRHVPHRATDINSNKNLIFYGGSFIFGLGLDDNATLPAIVQRKLKNLNVYSLSASGWGAQQLLWLIENGWIKKNVKNKQGGWVIYGLTRDHINRFLNHPRVITYVPTNPDTAFYKESHGLLSYQGTFRESSPLFVFLIEKFSKTSIGKQVLYSSLFKFSRKEQQRFCSLVKKSSELLKKKLNYNLAVFYYPNERIHKNINQCITENALVLDYTEKMLDLKKSKRLGIHPEDNHPSELQNQRLSDLITVDLDLLNL